MVDSNSRDGSCDGSTTGPCVKFPLRRVKLAVHRITKVAIPYHLDILSKQRSVIEKCQKLKQWEKLHDEQVKACLTVQQLKAVLYELETLSNQVDPNDLLQFERLVRPASEATLEQVRSFTEVCLPAGPVVDFFARPETSSLEVIPATLPEVDVPSADNVSIGQQKIYIEHIPDNTAASKSWNSLKRDLHDLHDLVSSFSNLVYAQREKVETIEDNVTHADEQVARGVTHLSHAAKLRRALLPVTGALVGLTLGGPVGLVLGTKMALGCALGAGLLESIQLPTHRSKHGKRLHWRQSSSAQGTSRENANSERHGAARNIQTAFTRH
ncbi:syntaxin-17 isoform X1 [Dermacentor andersoni]|uniref:syntaxin-17 isoform X1 n=1 Tax=Dermacentor andersoni TaxID=34620 RepID=UPI002155D4CA|nr:syntaxin-17-like isoform X1 [Dermacentor andersoni]